MSKVLHLDTSIQTNNSVSRRLSAAVVEKLKAADKHLEIAYRDLAAAPLPHLTMPVFAAFVQGAAVSDLSPEQQADAAESKKALDEFLAADTIVIGVAFYNYSVPSTLRSWIDRVVVAGKTFSYGPTGPKGLAGSKRVILTFARGGIFADGTPNAQHEHGETYLRSILSLVGITNFEVVIAEGLAISLEYRDTAVQGAVAKIESISTLVA